MAMRRAESEAVRARALTLLRAGETADVVLARLRINDKSLRLLAQRHGLELRWERSEMNAARLAVRSASRIGTNYSGVRRAEVERLAGRNGR